MSEAFLCSKESECPVVMSALDRAVKAEAQARLKETEIERKKDAMNELFKAGVSMREAENLHLKCQTSSSYQKMMDTWGRFDRALDACRNLKKPVQQILL